jgi:hypothetical protein
VRFKKALVDGDVLVYRIGFSSQETSEGIAKARMRQYVTDIVGQGANAGEFQGFLTPRGETFRTRLATTLPYKGQRVAPKPLHYEALRAFLVDGMGFTVAVDEEADDLLGIALVEGGEGVVCCTPDKDLSNVPGWHYNFIKNDLFLVTPEEAKVNFARQCLTGDATDNIPGLFKHMGVKCGPAYANRVITESTDPELFHSILLAEYRQLGMEEEEAEKRLLESAQLLWIRHKPKQEFAWDLMSS